MALTPELFDGSASEEATQDVVITDAQPEPSKTWRLDYENKRIRRKIDGDDALLQYIQKALDTARNRFVIYDGTYGSELDDLIGQDLTADLMNTEIPRLVTEALIYDDRIEDITNIEITRGPDGVVYVSFTVIKTEGGFLDAEVNI